MKRAVDSCLAGSSRWRRPAGAAATAIVVAAGVLAAPMLPASAAPSGQVTEFSAGITASSSPQGIAAGPDGNLWFTESAANKISRITPAGVVTEFGGLTGTDPTTIAAGPDGGMWFTEFISQKIGRISPSGVVQNFTTGINQTNGYTQGIAAGPDGNMWFTEPNGGRIGRITPAGTVTEFTAGITTGSFPFNIVAGPDGNMWFTELAAAGNRIGRITPTGTVTEFTAGITAGTSPYGIVAGPDGNMWFTESTGNRIGRITTAGVVTEFSNGSPTPNKDLRTIVVGPDGNLWFTELEAQSVARITTAGVVTEFSAGITGTANPQGITAGADGNMWFTEGLGNRVGRIGDDAPAPLVAAPVVSGSRVSGTVHTCKAQWATWAGQQPKTTSRGWLLDGVPIAGATGASYTPTAANVGHQLSCTLTVAYALVRVSGISATSAAITVKAPPPVATMHCTVVGGTATPKLKVVCRVTVIKASSKVRWKVTRLHGGKLVDRGHRALHKGKLVINLSHVAVHKGKYRVTLTKGHGHKAIVFHRTVHIHRK